MSIPTHPTFCASATFVSIGARPPSSRPMYLDGRTSAENHSAAVGAGAPKWTRSAGQGPRIYLSQTLMPKSSLRAFIAVVRNE